MSRTPEPNDRPNRLWQYARLIVATALAAIALGYYQQVLGRVEMTPFTIFEYVTRGALVGAVFWAFELFYVQSPRGVRFNRLTPGTRITVRVLAYIMLFETGFFIGGFLFHPAETARFLGLAAG